jgi:glycosyltransferase involved in cell wall biosynthesis
MKLLVLSYEYPPIGGGGGIICRNISENLARQGNEVTVLTTAPPSASNPEPAACNPVRPARPGGQHPATPSDRLVRAGSTRHQAPGNPLILRLSSKRKNTFQSNPVEMLSWIQTTKKFIEDTPGFVDFDICMAHFVLPGGEVAYWLKKKYGLPYVLISHGHEIPWVHPRQMLFLHIGAYFRLKKVCKHSALNFVQTAKMKANIDRFMGKKYPYKNVVVPNGVDPVKYHPAPGKRPQKLRILFTGRLVIQKDPMTFLKALRIFGRYTRNFEVHILGNGHLREKMERYVRKQGLTSYVKFPGKVSDTEMVPEYQAAHLMVAPSLNEGMSIAALEALSCGVYLMATRASGFEDMIQEGVNGEFIPFRNPPALAEQMVKFYKNRFSGRHSETQVHGVLPKIPGWKEISIEYRRILSGVCSPKDYLRR